MYYSIALGFGNESSCLGIWLYQIIVYARTEIMSEANGFKSVTEQNAVEA